MIWRKYRDFNARRWREFAECSGVVLRVGFCERVNDHWIATDRWHAFIGNEYVGTSATIDGAKLAAVLVLQQRLEDSI